MTIKDPVLPIWWGANQSGMQAKAELEGWRRLAAEAVWRGARFGAVGAAWLLNKIGLHKQLANRLIEPWMWITVLVSATEYDNWFALRCHPDAQPEIRHVAELMRGILKVAKPDQLQAGDWHLPLIDKDDLAWAMFGALRLGNNGFLPAREALRAVSVGRCARVSYLTHEGQRDLDEDVKLHDRLAQSGHWSPFEHVAQALETPEWSGNMRGFRQYRKSFPREHIGNAP